mmetsp:Transcript_34028/g.85432  ORF Transcript_34028/g.85432 Transcript_34028/m.85432 type:complete len:214 (-) Transcript_34028:4711-5352(-)
MPLHQLCLPLRHRNLIITTISTRIRRAQQHRRNLQQSTESPKSPPRRRSTTKRRRRRRPRRTRTRTRTTTTRWRWICPATVSRAKWTRSSRRSSLRPRPRSRAGSSPPMLLRLRRSPAPAASVCFRSHQPFEPFQRQPPALLVLAPAPALAKKKPLLSEMRAVIRRALKASQRMWQTLSSTCWSLSLLENTAVSLIWSVRSSRLRPLSILRWT